MWFALSGSFYGRKLPDKIFVYVRTFGEYKTEIYVGKSFSLLDTEQRNEIFSFSSPHDFSITSITMIIILWRGNCWGWKHWWSRVINFLKKHRKNCETALTPGIPSTPVFPGLWNFAEIVKFGQTFEIWPTPHQFGPEGLNS